METETLYIRNLHEKVRLETLKTSLNQIFKPYGPIKSLTCARHLRLRGQAFVVFENVESAKKALKDVNGFPLFSKPMDVQFSKKRSFCFIKDQDQLNTMKRKRDEIRIEKEDIAKKKKLEKQEKLLLNSAQQQQFQQQIQQFQSETDKGDPMQLSMQNQSSNITDQFLPPNKILFVQNLPKDTESQILSELFQQFPSFKEVRMVSGRGDIAFVEYDDEASSEVAKNTLNGYRLTDDKIIKVTFAKK
ncbi:hypothetical protein HDU92_002145 [Lobulomyces angularis]|nr:hypothetical protein HDU92_002145 [Lobulomyces angularis]